MPEAKQQVTSVVVVGLGGQGVLKASDITAEAAFIAGHDVKKAEVHGMSQRGGSVSSDVRYGAEVNSPMAPDGEADYLLSTDSTQVAINEYRLRKGGTIIGPGEFLHDRPEGTTVEDLDADPDCPITRRNINIGLLGVLSTYLDLPQEAWLEAVRNNLHEKLHAENEAVFAYGRSLREQAPAG